MKSLKVLSREYKVIKIIKYEKQNEEYEGIIIETAEKNIVRCRLGKKTPKKPGYFVAFWEKNSSNANQPFRAQDSPSELAIVIHDGTYEGVFIIPMQAALKYQIVTNGNKMGKMAMRFYPPWCKELNETARKTQKWQIKYFKDYS